MRYAIIIDRAPGGSYGAYAPDVPGCVAVGDTLEEVTESIAEALSFHFEGLLEEGLPIPEPATRCEYVDVVIPDAVPEG